MNIYISEPLLAGLSQKLKIIFNPGSLEQVSSSEVSLSLSPGLTLESSELDNNTLHIPAVKPYQEVEILVNAKADITPDASQSFTHCVSSQVLSAFQYIVTCQRVGLSSKSTPQRASLDF